MYSTIDYSKGSTNKVFTNLKARSKVAMKDFVSGGVIKKLPKQCLNFRCFKVLREVMKKTSSVMIIYLEVKQHETKFDQCVERVECQK